MMPYFEPMKRHDPLQTEGKKQISIHIMHNYIIYYNLKFRSQFRSKIVPIKIPVFSSSIRPVVPEWND
jgi:hypothetical protein